VRIRIKESLRVVVTIELLRRSVAVEVDHHIGKRPSRVSRALRHRIEGSRELEAPKVTVLRLSWTVQPAMLLTRCFRQSRALRLWKEIHETHT
jgi:hypothetical protein